MAFMRVLGLLLRLTRNLRFSRATVLLVLATGVIGGAASAALVAVINATLANLQSAPTSLAWTFAVLCLVLPTFRYLSSILLQKVAERAVVELRMTLAEKILAAPLRKLEKLGPPRLLTTITEDVDTIVGASVNLPQLLMNVTLILGVLSYLGWLSWRLFFLVLAGVLLGGVAYLLVITKAQRLFEVWRRNWDELYEHLRGLTEGTKELKMHRLRRRSFVDDCLRKTSMELVDKSVRANSYYYGANSIGYALFFVLIGVLLFLIPPSGARSTEILTGYTLSILYLVTPLDIVMNLIPALGRADISIRNIENLGVTLATDSREMEESEPIVEPAHWKAIELEGATHTYTGDHQDGAFQLGPIRLRLVPGEVVFIVGGNGSGKTTLAKLLVGLYRPERGRLVIDGEPVDESSERYRRLFSVVFSDFYLFERLLGLDSPDLDSAAAKYVEALALSHKVRVEGGRLSTLALSRGQRKRLALLTAYLEDRPIYLFDEWAADQDTAFKEVFYRQMLPALQERGKTVIVITHDDRFYDQADRIVKLIEGELVFDGPPDEFLASAEYRAGRRVGTVYGHTTREPGLLSEESS